MSRLFKSVVCFRCGLEGRHPTSGLNPDTPKYLVEIPDTRVIDFVCPKCGYTMIYIEQAFRYEIICEMGLLSIGEGNHNESIINFSTCLERYLEIICVSYAIKCGLSQEQIQAFWKRLGKSSERQRGAALIAYEVTRKATTPNLPNLDGLASIRNDVVHGGKLASRTEAKEYCQQVYNWVREHRKELFNDRDLWSSVAQYYISPLYIAATARLRGKEGQTATGPSSVRLSSSTTSGHNGELLAPDFDLAIDMARREQDRTLRDSNGAMYRPPLE